MIIESITFKRDVEWLTDFFINNVYVLTLLNIFSCYERADELLQYFLHHPERPLPVYERSSEDYYLKDDVDLFMAQHGAGFSKKEK
jgi:hypothetical protein